MNTIYYYYLNGSLQIGPFTLDEILKQPINPNTAIWKEGEPAWKEAIKFSELAELFASPHPTTPPPFSPLLTSPSSAQKDTSTLSLSKQSRMIRIIKTLFIFLIVGCGILFLINFVFRRSMNSHRERVSMENYQEKKISVLEVESANPSKFLTADGTYNRTLFGKKIKVHGTITNKATVANFKDITIEVIYYSDTQSEVSREKFILYDYVPSHSIKNFEWKIKPPSGASAINWKVVDAVPY